VSWPRGNSQLPAASQIEDVTDPEMSRRSGVFTVLAANRPPDLPLSLTFPLTMSPAHLVINHNTLLKDRELSKVQPSLMNVEYWFPAMNR
jgi:hypothetical protein